MTSKSPFDQACDTLVAKMSGIKARRHYVHPIFGHYVVFTLLGQIRENNLRDWLAANIEGRHSVDYQMRNHNVSFVRYEDALLTYLRFA